MLETTTASKTKKKPTVIKIRREIVDLRQEVETLRRELRHSQRLSAIGTLATMVAHEYNNILTPLTNYAQLAQKRPEFTEKALSRAISGGQAATRISQALLGLAGDSTESIQTFSIAELIEDTLAVMARDPKKDNIEFKSLIPKNLQITGLRIELQQVLLNLILNARYAVLQKQGTRKIEVSAHDQQNVVHLLVSDNGIGISRSDLPSIFEPFFTTKNAKPGQEEGNGLGLAVCREIMHSMNGDISVQSKLRRGTMFTLMLPKAV